MDLHLFGMGQLLEQPVLVLLIIFKKLGKFVKNIKCGLMLMQPILDPPGFALNFELKDYN